MRAHSVSTIQSATADDTVRRERETQTKTPFLAGRPDDRTREKIETAARVIEPFVRAERTGGSEMELVCC